MAKKPKTKIVGTNVVYPRREKSLFLVSERDIKGNLSEYLPNETMNRAFWETLRRKPEYLELCKEFDFNKNTGLISTKWIIKLENRDKLKRATDRARELWGIEQLFDPQKKYLELQPDIVNLFGVARKLVTALSPYGEYQFIQDGRYVILKIDISEPYDYIEPLIKIYLDHFRGQVKQKEGREHYKKQLEYLKVWDERLRGEQFPTIAIKLKISLDQARERYYRAFELILGKKYEKKVGRRLIIEKLEKTRDFKRLLDFEEKSKTEGLHINDYDAVSDDSSSIFSNPQTKLLIDDILKTCCQGCSDVECRASFLNGDLEILQDCPLAIRYLRS